MTGEGNTPLGSVVFLLLEHFGECGVKQNFVMRRLGFHFTDSSVNDALLHQHCPCFKIALISGSPHLELLVQQANARESNGAVREPCERFSPGYNRPSHDAS